MGFTKAQESIEAVLSCKYPSSEELQ